jgi:hypothetical protein
MSRSASGRSEVDSNVHRRSGENVALRAVVGTAFVALPVVRAGPVPTRGASLRVENRDLARVATLVAAEHGVERLLRRVAGPQQLESDFAIHRICRSLVRDDGKARLDVHGAVAGGKRFRLHGEAKLPG